MSVERVTMQDFILGKLSEAESRAFEDRLAREPALVRELEQSLRMSAGLEQLRRQGYFDRTASQRARRTAWVPALAAAAIAGAALILWASRVAERSDILLAGPALHTVATSTVAAQFTFVAVRGSSVPTLDLPRAGLIDLRAGAGPHENGLRYRIALLRQEQEGSLKPLASLSGVAASSDGYVHCYAVASRLSPGSYVLRIQPDPGRDDTTEVYPFNLGASGSPPPR